jgi:hypothetical protein
MRPYLIHTPIWDDRSVGIAEFRMRDNDFFDIQITYKNSDGIRLYPGVYRIKVSKAMKYPTQNVKGVKLRIIPIKDFKCLNSSVA